MKTWKVLVAFFFLLVVVDGALRKWAFPEFSTPLLLLKDVVLWGGVALYAVQRSPTELPRPLRKTWVPVLLGAYLFVVLLQAFNIRLPSLIVSGIGLKAHLAYVPLVVLLPPVIIQATEREMTRFLWAYTLLVFLPIVVLGVYQFNQPPTAWINTYVRETESIDTIVKGVVRVTGTFSYIGSFTLYLSFNAFLGGAVLLAGLRWNRTSLIWLGVILVSAIAILLPMTGSRSVVAIAVGGLIALLIGTSATGEKRARYIVGVIVIGGVVALGVSATGLGEGWEVFQERVERIGTDEAEGRLVRLLSGPIRGIERAGIFGYGVGSTHQFAPRVVPGATGHDWLPGGYLETSTLRLITELGALGGLVLLALKLSLLSLAYQTIQRSRRPIELIIGGTAFCELLAHVLLPVVFNLTASALYWGCAGAMIGVWSLQQVRSESVRPSPK